MNKDNKNISTSRDQESGGLELDKNHESYEKGYPAPGTRHAGEEGKDYHPAAHEQDTQESDDRRKDTGRGDFPQK